MIVHGFTPHAFNIATIQPLVKDAKKSINDSNNYRAIALSNPLAKIFDWVLLGKNSDQFKTNDLQFGFKPNSSTSHCTFAVMETVNYFTQHNSDAYVLLLDASKAFDKVNYIKLFNLLIERCVNPLYIRCLLYMYTNHELNVHWNGQTSHAFSTSNGVKQGAVLSPVLFGLYIDELLVRLTKSGYGCWIGHRFCGAFSYADDVSLVAPNLHCLKMMCNVCNAYANEFSLTFNPSKCKLINFSKDENIRFSFNEQPVDVVKVGTHLGHIIGPNVSSRVFRQASYDMTRQTNYVLANYSICNTQTIYKLFISYCTSFYGCCLWDLQHRDIRTFYTTWRVCLRKVLKLPARTHCKLLPFLAKCLSIEDQISSRILKFVNRTLLNDNHLVGFLMKIAVNGSNSAISSSLRHILAKHNVMFDTIFNTKVNFKHMCNTLYFNTLGDMDRIYGDLALDVLHEREMSPRHRFMSDEELDHILFFICTS